MRVATAFLAISVSLTPVISTAQGLTETEKANLEMYRIDSAIQYVSQKAYQANWCDQFFKAVTEWNKVHSVPDETHPDIVKSVNFWAKEVQKYNVTEKQVQGIRYLVEEFYDLSPTDPKSSNPFAMAHIAANCTIFSDEPLSLYLYNTAKE